MSESNITSSIRDDVYHAWLRQQLGVRDIQPGDFVDCRLYFDHQIDRALHRPSDDVNTAYKALVNAIASDVANRVDGTRINSLRQAAGAGYRTAITKQYIAMREKEGLPEIYFNYHAYAGGPQADPDGDWTAGYNGVTIMGRFTAFFSEKDRNAELHNPDTGDRWPESEIGPVSTSKALYHILRMTQFGGGKTVDHADCGIDDCEISYDKCEHKSRIRSVLHDEYQRFLQWRDDLESKKPTTEE